MGLRIKKVASDKKTSLQELAKNLGITYNSLYTRFVNPKFSSLEEIANSLDCEVAELIEVGNNFAHFYDEKGEWLGIRKK